MTLGGTGGGRTVTVSANTLTIGGAISGGGYSLTKAGSGSTLVLGGSNSYGGGTTVSAGVLSISSTDALPSWNLSGSYSVAPGAVLAVGDGVADTSIATILGTTNFTASAALGFDTTQGSRTYAGVLADTSKGALGLAVLGGNALTLSGSNTYSGGTTISAGTLAITGIASLGPGGSYAGNISISSSAILNYNSSAAQTLSGAISGSGGLTQSAGSILTLTGSNTYSGATTVSGGTLQIGNGTSGNLGNTAVTVLGGVFSETTANALNGTASLSVSGATALANLSTVNSYSGATTLSSGILLLSNTGALGSSALKLGGGTLQLRSDTSASFAVSSFGTAPNGSSTVINVNRFSSSSVTGNTLSLAYLPLGSGGILTLANRNGDANYNLSIGTLNTANNSPTVNNNMVNGTAILGEVTNTGASATKTVTFGGTSPSATTSVGAITFERSQYL